MVWSLSVCRKPSVRFSAIHGSTRLCSSCDHDKAVTAEYGVTTGGRRYVAWSVDHVQKILDSLVAVSLTGL
jgi:hypothetical protein